MWLNFWPEIFLKKSVVSLTKSNLIVRNNHPQLRRPGMRKAARISRKVRGLELNGNYNLLNFYNELITVNYSVRLKLTYALRLFFSESSLKMYSELSHILSQLALLLLLRRQRCITLTFLNRVLFKKYSENE